MLTTICSPAISVEPCSLRGVFSRRPEYGARRGVPRQRLATAAPGGTESRRRALRPGARSSLGTDPDASPVRESAAPEPKTATVERREASVLRRTQGASPAPGLPRYVQAQRVPRKHPYDSRRSAHPFRGCVKRKSKTRAQKTRRGNEETCAV